MLRHSALSKKLFVIAAVLALVGLTGIQFVRPQKVSAARPNTHHACRRWASIVSQGRLPGNYSYVTMEYGMDGNDYGRRYTDTNGNLQVDANGSWFNHSATDCPPLGLSGLFWDGNTIDYNSMFYQSVFDNAHGQTAAVHDIYMGWAPGAGGNASGVEYCGVPNIGWQDQSGWRGAFGIENCSYYPFASINDSIRVMIGTRPESAVCLGMAFNAGWSFGDNDPTCNRNVWPGDPRHFWFDVGRIYQGGGDFAGHLNHYKHGSGVPDTEALNNVSAFYRNAVRNRQSISDLDADLRDGSFHFTMFSANSRDATPPYYPWNVACQDLAPIAGFCAPPGLPADPMINHKASLYLTYVLGPPLVNRFSVTPNASTTLTPNEEAPNSVTFNMGASVANSPAGSSVNVNFTRSYFIRRSGTTIPLAGNDSGTRATTGSFDFSPRTIPLAGTQLGDEVCGRIVVTPAEGTMQQNGTVEDITVGSRTAEDCVRIVHKPYYKVYGGDIFAGAGQGAGCRVDTNASILSARLTNSRGSGTQLANYALGIIMDMPSAQVRNAGANPDYLAFANDSPQLDGAFTSGSLYTTYGGGLQTGNATCAPDYFAERPEDENYAANSLMINPAEDETWRHDGDLTLTANPAGVGAGRKVTIYVDGDVFINSNITYQKLDDFDTLGDLAALRVIARGNIYVRHTVTEINGLFVAQADSGSPNTTGRFYTCYPGRIPTAADMNDECRTGLTVYGAVVADLIKLTRSQGTSANGVAGERYDNSSGNPAERFIYTPEVWLTSGLESGGSFDSYRTLPPVL